MLSIKIAVAAALGLDRLRTAVREHWRRLLVGAALGWLAATVTGALVLGYLAASSGVASSNALAALVVYGGIVGGMVVAWRGR